MATEDFQSRLHRGARFDAPRESEELDMALMDTLRLSTSVQPVGHLSLGDSSDDSDSPQQPAPTLQPDQRATRLQAIGAGDSSDDDPRGSVGGSDLLASLHHGAEVNPRGLLSFSDDDSDDAGGGAPDLEALSLVATVLNTTFTNTGSVVERGQLDFGDDDGDGPNELFVTLGHSTSARVVATPTADFLGLGDDDEDQAPDLASLGHRTAALAPPAESFLDDLDEDDAPEPSAAPPPVQAVVPDRLQIQAAFAQDASAAAPVFVGADIDTAGAGGDEDETIQEETPVVIDFEGIAEGSAEFFILDFERTLIAAESLERKRDIRKAALAETKTHNARRAKRAERQGAGQLAALRTDHEAQCARITRHAERKVRHAEKSARTRVQALKDELERLRKADDDDPAATDQAPPAGSALLTAFKTKRRHQKTAAKVDASGQDEDALRAKLAQLAKKTAERDRHLLQVLKVAESEAAELAAHLSKEIGFIAALQEKAGRAKIKQISPTEIKALIQSDPRALLLLVEDVDAALSGLLN